MIAQRVALGRARAAEVLRAPGADPDAPTIVLLHGAGGAPREFDALAPCLAPLEVLAPALPGRGGSDGPPRERAGEAAAWLGELLAAAGVARPIVFGHSYGGAVAIEYALARPPDAVRALVLAATGARLRVHPAVLAGAREAARTGAHMPLAAAVFGPGADEATRARAEAVRALAPPASALADWLACDAFDRMADLGAIGVPTLAIAGELDPLTPPKYLAYLAAHIAGAEFAVIAGAAHMLPQTHPAAVADAIHAFIARRGLAR